MLAVLFWASCSLAGMNLDNYKVTFEQDFTTMTDLSQLSVSDWGPAGPGGSTWIAHTPYSGDWINFQNPSGPYLPFNVGNGYLTIRVQQEANGQYYGGLLASVDPKGNGFAQKYGYFEMSAQLPSGLGTWPAFWLSDLPSIVNQSRGAGWVGHEIDVLEAYGDGPGIMRSTVHLWASSSSQDWGWGQASTQCTMYNGFHKYGMDIQPDFLTVYYDRQMVMQFPNKIPGQTENYDREMYIMLNLATGGGGNTNNATNLNRGPQDMLVEYVRVWQGSGGSADANSTTGASSLTWLTSQFTLNAGETIQINGTSMTVTKEGDWQVLDTQGNILWHSNTTNANCATQTCYADFQNDGNLLLKYGNTAYWGTSTWGDNMGSMTFQNQPPWIVVHNYDCHPLWSSPDSPPGQ